MPSSRGTTIRFAPRCATLGVLEPDHEPYATRYIPQIVEMIGELMERGYAYATEDGVYYRVAAFSRYGALSGKNVDELLVGARIAENEHKDDPLDFALWKFAKPGEPRWDSPWGAGRPGWHIECSAMSRALLGVPFDIHGGGYDLIFPHHENEIAQSEPLMDAPPMAEMWVHGGLLNFDGRKMSKSLGNFEPLSELLERHDPLAIRLLFLQTGYRKPMNFTEESVTGATAALEKLVNTLSTGGARRARTDPAGPHGSRARGIPRSDLRTARRRHEHGGRAGRAVRSRRRSVALRRPEACATKGWPCCARSSACSGSRRRSNASIRSRSTQRSSTGCASGWATSCTSTAPARPKPPSNSVIEARNAARKGKEFALSDRLRDALAAEGITLRDSKEGTTWTRAGG